MTNGEPQRVINGEPPLSTEEKITELAQIVIEALNHVLGPEPEGYHDLIKDRLIERLQGLK